MNQKKLDQWICHLPKVELHLHIEGTLEPELMFDLAKRNGLSLPFKTSEELKRAYNFQDLQSFLHLYYEGSRVLIQEQDFFDLTWTYLRRMVKETVRHVEIFFDPQAHMNRGIDFHTVISGIHSALGKARTELGLSSKLIPCFLRDFTPESARQTLEKMLAYRDWVWAVGLDSSERGRPPELFQDVFDQARTQGLLTVAHAGEEGPPDYIWQALDLLKVVRIDHGIRCVEDESLVQHLAHTQIPLTVCPLSNVKLNVFPSLDHHNLKLLLRRGLCVSIHSDDPAYFGGYLTDNYLAAQRALNLEPTDILQLARNAVMASFLSDTKKEQLFREIECKESPESKISSTTTITSSVIWGSCSLRKLTGWHHWCHHSGKLLEIRLLALSHGVKAVARDQPGRQSFLSTIQAGLAVAWANRSQSGWLIRQPASQWFFYQSGQNGGARGPFYKFVCYEILDYFG